MASQLEKDRMLYKILQLPEGAPPEEVKRAYRLLAVKYHPDKNPGNEDAAEQFKLINTAHQVLTDPTRKAAYDRAPPEPRGPSDGTRVFAQGVYRDSSLSDLEKKRREREQEMMRRRAARDPVRQGQEKRNNGAMPEAQREFWRAKDKERESELSARVKREREGEKEKELQERMKEAEAARRKRERAEEACTRAAARARERDRDKDPYQAQESERRSRLEAERQRQEEARRREIDRQIARHQRQAEQARDNRRLEQQRRFDQQQEEERLAAEREEGRMRRDASDHEELYRMSCQREMATLAAECNHREQRGEVWHLEATRRKVLTGREKYSQRLIQLEGIESSERARLSAGTRTRLSDLFLLHRAARSYWGDAYERRRTIQTDYASVARQLTISERLARGMVELQRAQVQGRRRIEEDYVPPLVEAALARERAKAGVEARDLERRMEADRRVSVMGAEQRDRLSLLRAHSLDVRQAEEGTQRKALSENEAAERAELRQAADARGRRLEELRFLARRDSSQDHAVVEAKRESADMRDALRRALLEANHLRVRVDTLENENATLRADLQDAREIVRRSHTHVGEMVESPLDMSQEVLSTGRTTPRPRATRAASVTTPAVRTSSRRMSGRRSPSPAPFEGRPRTTSGRKSPRVYPKSAREDSLSKSATLPQYGSLADGQLLDGGREGYGASAPRSVHEREDPFERHRTVPGINLSGLDRRSRGSHTPRASRGPSSARQP